MKRTETLARVLKAVGAILAAALALSCGSATGQAVKTAPIPNRNISLAGPQRQGAPAGHALPGTIEGFVYWDAQTITHKPMGTCDGFSVTVTSGGLTVGNPSAQFGAKYVGQVKAFLVGGKVLVYDACSYAYSNVPEGPQLQVQLNLIQPTAFTPSAAPSNPVVGPVTVINAQCNMLPNIMNPTLADLRAHWGSCQNMAYDVNFLLQRSTGALRGAGVAPQPLLQGSSTTRPMMGGSGGATGNPGMLVPAVKPAADGPSISGGTASNPAGVSKGVLGTSQTAPKPTTITLPPPTALPKITNPRLGQQDAALIGLLREQRLAADQRSAQLKLGASQTMSSPTTDSSPRSVATAIQLQPNLTAQTGQGSGGSGLQISNRQYAEPITLTCAKNPGPRIVSAPAVFTPEAKYNSYWIYGCGFGSKGGAYIRGGQGFQVNLRIDFWSDHEIKVHLPPALSGVLDQDNITLVVLPTGMQEMPKSGLKFYAARGFPAPDGGDQDLQLIYGSVPQSHVSSVETPVFVGASQIKNMPLILGYDQVPPNATSQFPSFSFGGDTVVGWIFRYAYGHQDGGPLSSDCYINDVHQADQPPSAGAIRGPCSSYFNYAYYAKTGGEDTWSFALAPGFEISAYRLYYEAISPRSLCGAWDEVSHKDGLTARWSYNLGIPAAIIVQWPVYYCTDSEAAPFSRTNTQYQSAYGLAVSVMGPRCVDPWTGGSDQACINKVRQMLGN